MMDRMSERAPGSGDVPMACPFIAFEDDRQRRSTMPDHRHRCYAERPPAARAISHQQGYCLTGNFPACPTFQDWARREAARGVAGEIEEAPAGRREDALAFLPQASGGPTGRETGGGGHPSEAYPPTTSRNLWGSGPEQLGAFDAPGARRPPSEELVSQKGSGDEELAAFVRGEGSGEPGGPADAGDEAAFAWRRADTADEGDEDSDEAWAESESDDAEEPDFLAGRSARAATDEERGSDAGQRVGREGRAAMAARTRHRPIDTDAPSWERPRRFEAYPTLKTRTGVGGISPVLLGIVALVVAAAVLFILPGMLGGGGGGGGGTPTPTPGLTGTIAVTTPTVAPTAASPTALVYTVKAGDTLSAIAQRYGVTIAQIQSANPQIKDVNKIAVGDQITIPTPPPPSSSAAAGTGAPASGTSAP
jgi:LysM repeat protein